MTHDPERRLHPREDRDVWTEQQRDFFRELMDEIRAHMGPDSIMHKQHHEWIAGQIKLQKKKAEFLEKAAHGFILKAAGVFAIVIILAIGYGIKEAITKVAP